MQAIAVMQETTVAQATTTAQATSNSKDDSKIMTAHNSRNASNIRNNAQEDRQHSKLTKAGMLLKSEMAAEAEALKPYLLNKIVFVIGNTIGKPATVTYTTQKIGSTTPPPVTGTDF
jgi:hypothetical protein